MGTPQGYPAGSPQPSPVAAQAARNIPTGVPVRAASAGATAAVSASRSPGIQVGREKSASVMARRRSNRSKMVLYLAAGIGILILCVAIALLAVLGGNGEKGGKPSTKTTSNRPTATPPTPIRSSISPSRSIREKTRRPGTSVVREYKRDPEGGEGTDRRPEPSVVKPPPGTNVEPGANLMGSTGVEPQPDSTNTSNPVSQPKSRPAEPEPATRQKAEPTLAPVAKPKREDVEALASALKAARAALEECDFDDALTELKKVISLTKLPEHQAMYQRLHLLTQYSRQFRSLLLKAIGSLEAGSGIKLSNDEYVAVVSATPEQLTVRVGGTSRSFAINELPPGLAIAVADSWLDQEDPVTPLLKAAYIASLKDAKEDELAKAREWFQEAARRGVDIRDLAEVIDDTYDLGKDLAQ